MSEHDHDHASSATMSSRVGTLLARLEARAITTENEIDESVERFLLAAHPGAGARIVARAWVDPVFKARLLDDANAAIAELGLDLSHWANVKLRAVANSKDEHNVIVCTLCSCYPIALLGPSPKWYKSEAYRSRVVRDPRAVLAEFGTTIPSDVAITVWDSTAELRYIVLPQRPSGTENLDETQLAALVTRNGMIGTALV